ncbi:type II toxin-antitoxin system HicB family antitoxin [Methanogenium organophilum]|uniref:Type II toxin-antitoxin system HicB family antitoxin n=1 Tax=Methanogenium organophilum TaxID=2199 RepID=A0A9X9S6C3_METOG|nr:type II toxin-antitoxin system HicB family antitoxin [Methanogenium organophilum]WAI02235.1 type II toxin-antitoxin system HicB family antitoxin [Methanogenium organophilum]
MTQFSVIVEKDEDGYYAHVPALQGCYAQGDTYEEAIENIKDVTKLHLEDLTESG